MAQPGSVVRMIYRVLGEKHFQEGLQLYFARHKYGNTRTIDLWNAWKEAGSAFYSQSFSTFPIFCADWKLVLLDKVDYVCF